MQVPFSGGLNVNETSIGLLIGEHLVRSSVWLSYLCLQEVVHAFMIDSLDGPVQVVSRNRHGYAPMVCVVAFALSLSTVGLVRL